MENARQSDNWIARAVLIAAALLMLAVVLGVR